MVVATKMILLAAPADDTLCGIFYFILFFRFSLEGAERVTRSDIQGRFFIERHQ